MVRPTKTRERELSQQGFVRIAGVDEAGCGALAGPVVAAAVIIPLSVRVTGVRDSKLLTALARERLCTEILACAESYGVGIGSVEEITQRGIRAAGLLAMRRAIEQVKEPDFAIVDAWNVPGLSIPQQGIIRADASVFCVAAASILAKVTRDRMMDALAREYPQYGFDVHKGYATLQHRKNIHAHGPCPHHRPTFACRLPSLIDAEAVFG